MRKLGSAIYLVLAVVIGTFSTSYASEQSQKDGFTISIPSDWEEMPREVIDDFEERLAKLAPDARQHYDYGFQLASTENWFDYPYILVQVANIGRVPESQLENIEEFKEGIDKGTKKLSKKLPKIQVGKVYFDKNSNIIWSYMNGDVGNVGHVSALSGLVLTEKGYIQVNGYAPEEDFPVYEATFQTITESIVPEQGLVYNPEWSDSSPPSGTSSDSTPMAGVAGGLILALIFSRLIRRKS